MKIQLIDDVGKLYRRFSVQFALLAGTAAAWAVDPSNHDTVLGYIEAIPQPWRSIATFTATAGLPILLTAIKQKPLSKD